MTNPIDDQSTVQIRRETKEVTVNEKKNDDVDGGWAWVVLFACTVGSVIGGGQFFNSGIYFFVFLREFGKSRSATMWITAAQGAASAVAGVIASHLIVRIGARKTMFIGSLIMGTSYGMMFFATSIFYGIVCFGSAGVGAAFLLLGNIEAMGYFFKRRLNVAMGVVLAGSGLGVTIIGLEIEWAVKYYGWRGAMLIQAGLLYQISGCAATIYSRVARKSSSEVEAEAEPQPPQLPNVERKESENDPEISRIPTTDINNTSDKEKQEHSIMIDTTKKSRKYLSEPKFWIQLLGFVFYFASITVTYQILKDFIISQGFSFSYNTVMICNGVSNGIGRVSGGFLASAVTPTLLNSIVTIICGGATALFFFTEHEWVILMGVTLFGLSNGHQGAPQTVSWATLFGKDLMAVMYGYSIAAGGIPTLTMSPLAGYIIDKTGSFMPVVLLSSFLMAISGLLFMASHCMHKRKIGNHKFHHEISESPTA